jgi:hypothetical protein
MQNLEIFRTMEGIYFEFTSLNQFWKNLEKIKPCGARLSVALSEQRHPERAPASRPLHRRHFPTHHSRRRSTIVHHISWL